MRNSSCQNFQERFQYLKDELKKRFKPTDENMDEFDNRVRMFFVDFKSRWTRSHRVEDRFFRANRSWLDSGIAFISCQRDKRGRKETSFELSDQRT